MNLYRIENLTLYIFGYKFFSNSSLLIFQFSKCRNLFLYNILQSIIFTNFSNSNFILPHPYTKIIAQFLLYLKKFLKFKIIKIF